MSAERPRVGFLGGTFNPVHLGHIAAAQAACDALALDRVLLVPSHQPPHRPLEPRVSAFHRFAMVSLAIGDSPRLAASDVELNQSGPSYTAVTLRRLHETGLTASQIFFILGTDAFAEIATWYQYPAVLDLAHFVVISRDGHSFDQVRAALPDLGGRMATPADPQDDGVGRTRIYLVSSRTPDVSSTAVRTQLAAGQDVAGMVGAAVERHIRRHGLYGARCAE